MSPLVPTEAQSRAVERLASVIVRFGPTRSPAGCSRPSNGFPATEAKKVSDGTPISVGRRGGDCKLYAASAADWDALASLLEDRRGIDFLLDRIEALDDARRAEQQPRDA